MSNTMTAHEPINYLDSILSEEEKRCEQYSHQRRNFTISRSGRFKSKNKHRNVVDGKMFDRCTAVNAASNNVTSDKDKINTYHAASNTMSSSSSAKSYQAPSATVKSNCSSPNFRARDKMDAYKSYYETNL
uniref:Uncharacterized protein n=1 Tax=Glossina pallidipes TaxID=7398 RepID=A0A1B0AJX4_GLOPL